MEIIERIFGKGKNTKSYPSKKDLERIKKWYLFDVLNLIKFIDKIWNKKYGKIEIKGKRITFITGGWYGNENIIKALQENKFFWECLWVKSMRGGIHVFEIEELKEWRRR